MSFGRIPAELRALNQWVLWRREERDGKDTKVPYRAREPFVRAISTDPTSWASYELAAAVADQADGIGFVFTENDPFCGADLDLELSEDERTTIARQLDSYTEMSVSGGWHIIVRASLNGGGRHPRGIGVFDRARYFVMTGEHVAGMPTTIEERQLELDFVLARYLPTAPWVNGIDQPSRPVDLDDRELLAKMFASKSGDKIRRLWEGDWSDYPSASEGDLALAGHLAFWTNRDPLRIETLLRSSGLMRPKWEREDYRARTIDAAIAGTSVGYSDSGFRPIEIEPAGIENQGLPMVPDSQSSSGATTGKALPFQPLAVLVDSAPAEPEWTWQGYLARFAVALLAGRPKVGKSTLVMALVADAVQGEAFLELPAKSGGVLLLTEERRDTIAEKARILGLMDEEVPVHVLTRGDVRDTLWPEVVRQAMTYCSEHELDVLVVDTLDRWTGLRGDAENAAGAVNEAMEPLLFAAAAGLAVLAVSHQRKSGGEYGEAVRGSNAFTGAVDVVIELERPSRTLQLGGHARVLRTVSRLASTREELFFELGDDGFLAISDVAEKKADAERAQVLDELEKHASPVNVNTLAESVDLGKRALRRRLTELRDTGHALRTGEGKKGDPYLWAAVDQDEEVA